MTVHHNFLEFVIDDLVSIIDQLGAYEVATIVTTREVVLKMFIHDRFVLQVGNACVDDELFPAVSWLQRDALADNTLSLAMHLNSITS